MEKPPSRPAVRHPMARLATGIGWILLVAVGAQVALQTQPGQRNAGSIPAAALVLAAVAGAYLAFVSGSSRNDPGAGSRS